MRTVQWILLTSAFCAGPMTLAVQETNDVEQLKRQLQEMRDSFEKTRQAQQQQLDALTQKLEAVSRQLAGDAEKKKLEQQLTAELQPAGSASAAAPAAWSPAE